MGIDAWVTLGSATAMLACTYFIWKATRNSIAATKIMGVAHKRIVEELVDHEDRIRMLEVDNESRH